MEPSSSSLFAAIAGNDTEALVELYGQAAVNALLQYQQRQAVRVTTEWDRATARGACV